MPGVEAGQVADKKIAICKRSPKRPAAPRSYRRHAFTGTSVHPDLQRAARNISSAYDPTNKTGGSFRKIDVKLAEGRDGLKVKPSEAIKRSLTAYHRKWPRGSEKQDALPVFQPFFRSAAPRRYWMPVRRISHSQFLGEQRIRDRHRDAVAFANATVARRVAAGFRTVIKVETNLTNIFFTAADRTNGSSAT